MPPALPVDEAEPCEDRTMSDGDATVDGRGCPSDDELAAFVEHTLQPAQRRRIAAHIDHCDMCRAAVGHVVGLIDDAPKQIGRYRLDEKLGSGGMGVVLRAWDPALEREIAIELLHSNLHDAAGRDRAIREARALARLQHPNVVAVYDVGEHDGGVFIATELVDGETLDIWQRGKPARDVIAAYAQAARGLAAAHALGLVHRDVNPSNIFVGRDQRVRASRTNLSRSASIPSAPRSRSATAAVECCGPNSPTCASTRDRSSSTIQKIRARATRRDSARSTT